MLADEFVMTITTSELTTPTSHPVFCGAGVDGTPSLQYRPVFFSFAKYDY